MTEAAREIHQVDEFERDVFLVKVFGSLNAEKTAISKGFEQATG